jgi:hypothetical protein
MTQAKFDSFPMLLRPTQVGEALGLDLRAVRKLREAKPEIATVLPGKTNYSYFKCAIAALARLEYH